MRKRLAAPSALSALPSYKRRTVMEPRCKVVYQTKEPTSGPRGKTVKADTRARTPVSLQSFIVISAMWGLTTGSAYTVKLSLAAPQQARTTLGTAYTVYFVSSYRRHVSSWPVALSASVSFVSTVSCAPVWLTLSVQSYLLSGTVYAQYYGCLQCNKNPGVREFSVLGVSISFSCFGILGS